MNVSNTIESYRKRRKQMGPLILGIAALLLVVIGIIIVVISLNNPAGFNLFASKTPTPTITFTPTTAPTLTNTPTLTETPTITPTETRSTITNYVVKEGDSLLAIIEAEGLADTPNALIIIYMLNPTIDPMTGNITVGQTILLPPPNYPMPTPTLLPTGLAPGSKIIYRVVAGDSLNAIATLFNSTVADIVNSNKEILTEGEATTIYPGQLLVVPIDLVTPVPTKVPTPTATP